MSMIIFRFDYDDASMYVLTPVLPYSCAHTKVYIYKKSLSISCLHLYQVTQTLCTCTCLWHVYV